MKEFFTLRTLLKLALLSIAANSLVAGIKISAQGMTEARFQPVAYFAVAISFALGWMNIRTRKGWSIILVGGLCIIFLEAGRLSGPVVHLLKSLPGFEFEAIRSLLGKKPIDAAVLKWQSLIIRDTAIAFLRTMFGSVRSTEKILVEREVLWGVLVFLLSSWSGWWTARYKAVFPALIPSLALQSYIVYYTKADAMSLQMGVFVLLLLMGITHKWDLQSPPTEQVDRANRETYSVVFFIALVATLVAGFVPSLSLREVAERITRKGSIGEALGLQGTAPGGYTTTGLPRSHLVGANPFNSQIRIFSVKTGELPASESAIVSQAVPRHYWRWLVYDKYDGRVWSTSEVKSDIYPANERLITMPLEEFRILHQQIEKANPKDTRLYWAGQLLSADQGFEAAWRVPPGSEPDPNPPTSSDMMGALIKVQTYSADSLIPVISEEQLRASKETYPKEIREKYLPLPDTITDRTRHLAGELTMNIEHPYDKARAIEAYLRSFPYSLKIPSLPDDREVTDYFLFELRSGYCDYYATSMIVLARAAGLPARLIIGYAGGEYDARKAEYIIREADGHSWVEIYFSGIGWIEFEPTAGRPPISIPEILDRVIVKDGTQFEITNRGNVAYTKIGMFPKQVYWPIIPALILIVVFSSMLFLTTQGFLMHHRSVLSIYGYIYKQGRYFRKDAPVSETPTNFARALKTRLSSNRRWLQPAEQELELLTSYYLRETYSTRLLSKTERRRAVTAWRRLFWRLMFARIMNL